MERFVFYFKKRTESKHIMDVDNVSKKECIGDRYWDIKLLEIACRRFGQSGFAVVTPTEDGFFVNCMKWIA